MTPITRPIAMLLLVLAFGAGETLLAPAARGAEVSIEVSSRAVEAGEPFSLSVVIDRAEEYERPTLPAMEGIVVAGGPFRSESTNIVNGQLVQAAVTLTWQLVVPAPGEYLIPPVSVVADGQEFQSRPITIVATAGPPPIPDVAAEDLVFARITADRERIYLGEPLRVTLRVWVSPFRHAQLNGPLDSEQMWQFVDTGNSDWGDFANAIEQLRTPFGGLRLRGRREIVQRDGGEAIYYRYDFDAQIWPRRAGALAVAPVEVKMEYPTEIGRTRSVWSFDRSLRVTRSQRVAARATPPEVEVLAPPESGRPPTFNGAVGRFAFRVDAKPTQVAVGDPITLTLTVEDRTPGGTRLDLLAPPPLERVPDMERDFRVPADPLTGVVDGHRKTFTQTVRAKHDGVAAIPAIPLAYFDPEAETYVTVASDPIPLEVRPSSTLAMTDVVGGAGSAGPRATELTRVTGGLLANASGPDLLRVDRGFGLRWMHAVLLALPCLLFAGAAVGQRYARRLRHDDGFIRRRNAKRSALRRIGEARRSEGNHAAERVAAAVSDYVADRCNVPAGTLTRAEVGARLAASGVKPEVGAEVERLLAECEHVRFAGGARGGGGAGGARDAGRAGGAGDSIPERAVRCIERLERERIR